MEQKDTFFLTDINFKTFAQYHFCITTQKLIIWLLWKMVIQEYGLYIIIICLLQVVLMDTIIILLPIMVAMVLLLELVQVVEVQEIVILAEELVNIGKKLGNIQEIHIRRK